MNDAVSGLDPELKAFRDAAAEGKLILKRCDSCGEHFHHPRPFCPFCHSADTSWIEASGRGEIYSFTIWRRRGDPVIPALIALEEGPIITSRLVGTPSEAVHIGQPVKVAFEPAEYGALPVFAPTDWATAQPEHPASEEDKG